MNKNESSWFWTFLFWIIVVICVVGMFGDNDSSSNYSTTPSSYDTVPYGMSEQESNYIGNRLQGEGYSESEAVKVREAIRKFNENSPYNKKPQW